MNPGICSSNEQKYCSRNPVKQYLIRRYQQAMMEMLQPLKYHSILDIGCGEGFNLQYLKAHLDNDHIRLSGMDIRHPALLKAQTLCPSADLFCGNIFQLPVKPAVFDVVLCLEVLEHLQDPDTAIQNILSLSRNYCLFTVPHEPWFSTGNLLAGKNLYLWGKDPEHIQHWGYTSFLYLISRHAPLIQTVKSFPWSMVLVQKDLK